MSIPIVLGSFRFGKLISMFESTLINISKRASLFFWYTICLQFVAFHRMIAVTIARTRLYHIPPKFKNENSAKLVKVTKTELPGKLVSVRRDIPSWKIIIHLLSTKKYIFSVKSVSVRWTERWTTMAHNDHFFSQNVYFSYGIIYFSSKYRNFYFPFEKLNFSSWFLICWSVFFSHTSFTDNSR